MSESLSGRQAVLIVTDRDFYCTAKGNRQRIVALVHSLRRLSYRVILACSGLPPSDPLWLQCDDVIVVNGPVFQGGDVGEFDPTPYLPVVHTLSRRWDPVAAIVQYAWMTRCFEELPAGCLRIVDTHDVLSQRYARFAEKGLCPWVTCDVPAEVKLLSGANVVMAIQEEDAAYLTDILADRCAVICVPHGVALDETYEYRPSVGETLGFVGSKHHGNLGLLEFMTECWPTIRGALPDCELKVFGTICEWIGPAMPCRREGIVDSISRAYEGLALVVAPLTVGTGLKIKVVEALRHGRTIVTTPVGIEGMPAPSHPAWVSCTDWADFSDAVIRLLSEPEERRSMERAAMSYAFQHYSERAIDAAISKVLSFAGQDTS